MDTLFCSECNTTDCLHMLSPEQIDALCDRELGDSERGLYGNDALVQHYNTRIAAQIAEWQKYGAEYTMDRGPRDAEVLEDEGAESELQPCGHPIHAIQWSGDSAFVTNYCGMCAEG